MSGYLSGCCANFLHEKTVVDPAPAHHSLLQVFNLAGSDVSLNVSGSNLFPEPIKRLQVTRGEWGKTNECTAQYNPDVVEFNFFHSGPSFPDCRANKQH